MTNTNDDKIKDAAIEVADAISYVDSIRIGKEAEVSYETMQKANFNRPTGWRRKYNLKDAKSDANAAAIRLRRAWEILDPTTPPHGKTTATASAELRTPDMGADAPRIQPRAYLHRAADTCVSTDPDTYENPRVLVAWDDVADAVDWLEKGIGEWRAYAIEAGKQLAKLRANQKDQLAALVAAEAFACRVRHWEEGKPDLHDTKVLLRDTIAKGTP